MRTLDLICAGSTPEEAMAAGRKAAGYLPGTLSVRLILLSGDMAGGGSACHLRIGTERRNCSPVIPPGRADLILAAEPGEAVRQLRFLKKDGCVVTGRGGNGGGGYRPGECLRFLKRRVRRLFLVPEDIPGGTGEPSRYERFIFDELLL